MKDNIVTNDQLIVLLHEYGLTQEKAADLLCMSHNSIRAYTCDPGSTRHRNMPEAKLKLLKMLIRQKGMKKVK